MKIVLSSAAIKKAVKVLTGKIRNGTKCTKGGTMKRYLFLSAIVCMVFGIALIGCGQEKAASSNEAIDVAKAMETAKEKADYLIGQAKAFYNSKEFQQAVDVAQYVLRYVDKDSSQAKDLLEKAKNSLAEAAKAGVEGAKKSLGAIGQQ